MVICLPILMVYSLVGEFYHEIAGTIMFVLFIVHHFLNRRWFGTITKGRQTIRRVVSSMINLLLIPVMLLVPISGMLMSKYLYTLLRIPAPMSIVRLIHLSLSHWGLILMSLHVGMHVGSESSKFGKWTNVVYLFFLFVGAYGCYAFFLNRFPSYLFLTRQFFFIDFSASVWLKLVQYFSTMVFFTILSTVFVRLMKRLKQ